MQSTNYDANSVGSLVRDWLESLIDTKEAAKLIGLSPATLSTMRSRGIGGPEFHRLGRRVKYKRKTCLEFAAARTCKNTSTPVPGIWHEEPQ